MAVVANERAGAERARALAQPPQPKHAPTVAMSLEQLLTVEAPPEEEVLEAATLPVTQEQSGERAAELKPNAVLVDSSGGLTADTDTGTLVPSLPDELRRVNSLLVH